MSYSTITRCANDPAFRDRVTAAVSDEAWNGANSGTPFATDARANPSSGTAVLIWPTASAADVEAAYASAIAAGNPNPGGDESVVTDAMILANVQGHWPT